MPKKHEMPETDDQAAQAERLRRVSVILCRTRYGGNIGSAARVVKNMGLGGLVLAAPEEDAYSSEARMMAASAYDVLSSARTTDTLEEAVAPFKVVLGTSRRVHSGRSRIMDPREGSRALLDGMGEGTAAVVFGPEDDGLSAAELGLCSGVVSIPSDASYPSLNLSHSVMVMGYELRMAAGLGGGAVRSFGEATEREMDEALAQAEAVLETSGFFLRNPRGRVMLHLREILARGASTSQDARILRGMFRRIAWALKRS